MLRKSSGTIACARHTSIRRWGASRKLKYERSNGRDLTLAALSRVLLREIEEGRSSNRLFIDQLALSVVAYIAQAYGGLRLDVSFGGLAPWQERRATEIMRARLGSGLSIREVAAECRLSPSHFARMFRRSKGVSPHEYLSILRLEEARQLMRQTKLPLSDIALIFGFNDQSHFTRVFTRRFDTSPGLWRRTNTHGNKSAAGQ